MPRPLAFQVLGIWTTFEMTLRCIQSRFLMRPGDECTKRIVGVIARSQELYGRHVRIHFGGGLSTHMHLLVSTDDPIQFAHFKCHMMTNLSKELGDLHNWPGPLFHRPVRSIPVVDEEAIRDRVRYESAHGRKENLIGPHDHWPGVPWIRAALGERDLTGIWYERTKFGNALNAWYATPKNERGRKPTLRQFGRHMTLRLHPLPFMEEMSEQEQQDTWRQLFEEGKVTYPPMPSERTGKVEPPPDIEKLLNEDPHTRYPNPKKSPAPCVHASTWSNAQAWMDLYDDFVDAYRAAWKKLRGWLSQTDHEFAFPLGGVPPTMPPTPQTS